MLVAEVQRINPRNASPFHASAFVIPTDILLAKARYTNELKAKWWGRSPAPLPWWEGPAKLHGQGHDTEKKT